MLPPVLYTGIEMGGQLTKTTDVENFPGFPEGVDGNMLMSHMEQQARRFGTDIRMGVVTQVRLSKEKGQPHRVVIDGEKQIDAQALIVATGASARGPGSGKPLRLGVQKGAGPCPAPFCTPNLSTDLPVYALDRSVHLFHDPVVAQVAQ